MNLLDATKSGFTHYAGFSGRARRSEFWYWVLFTVMLSIVSSALDQALGTAYTTDLGDTGGVISTITGLGTFLPSLAVFWRRMHDIGRSGAWWFCLLIPLANIVFAVVFIVWAAKDSDPGQNQYGPSPKAQLNF